MDLRVSRVETCARRKKKRAVHLAVRVSEREREREPKAFRDQHSESIESWLSLAKGIGTKIR